MEHACECVAALACVRVSRAVHLKLSGKHFHCVSGGRVADGGDGGDGGDICAPDGPQL